MTGKKKQNQKKKTTLYRSLDIGGARPSEH